VARAGRPPDHLVSPMTQRPITVDDLWAMKRVGAPSLAPDGAQAVAAVTHYRNPKGTPHSELWLYSLLGGRPRRLTHGPKDGQPRWSPRGDAIAFVARREGDETPQLYTIAPDGGEARRVGQMPTGVIAFKWFADGQRIALASWVWPEAKRTKALSRRLKHEARDKANGLSAYATEAALYRHWDDNLPQGRQVHLWVMDVASGKAHSLFHGTPYQLTARDPDANCFDIAPDGSRIAFGFDPGAEQGLLHRDVVVEIELASGKARTLAQHADWHFAAPRYSPDGKRVAMLASQLGQAYTAPEHLVIADARGWQLVSDQWDREVAAPLVWADDGSHILFAAEDEGRRHLWQATLHGRKQATITRRVEGGTVAAFDAVGDQVVTLIDAAAHPPQLFAHTAQAEAGDWPRRARLDAHNARRLARLKLGRSEAIALTGAQGEPVQVWLHYPPGFNARRRHPVLHTIHGGPHTAPGDTWHWRWNYAVFAAQGYVVANVNYHGSSSFGHAFKASIVGRLGELELQDVEATTDWLAAQPWADPRRLFASGGSYGGYMVAWMNGHLPKSRYAAYVCHAGCWDWVAMFADDAWMWHVKELGAWYWDDMARVQSQNPQAFAAGLTTPTLVIHGAKDYRVPDAQGLAYYNTLKAQGIPARLLWYPDENHWILKPANNKRWYREFFDWLARHDVKPDK